MSAGTFATDTTLKHPKHRPSTVRRRAERPSTDAPVILVGTHRSGTSWFGNMLATHPDLAYWLEPRHVWTWGNSYLPDDRMTADHARPRVIRHIRSTFARYARQRGKSRFCEKTPSNCLRLPFIHEVYPEARIILIIRDGRSVIRSAAEKMSNGVPTHRIVRRAMQTPVWEWPSYVPRTCRTVRRKFLGQSLDYWGPRPPGWRDWLGQHPRNVILAKQWAETIRTAVQDAERLGPEVVHTIRYEHVMARPQEVMQGVVDHLRLANSERMIEHVVSTVDPARQRKWRDVLTQETLEEVRPHMEPMLNRLGYGW